MNRKKIIRLLILLATIWILFQAACYGYWWLRAWEGPDLYAEMKDRVRALPSEQVIKKLHSFQISSPYPFIALQILVERKEKKIVPILLKQLKSWNRHDRHNAIWALGIIGDERAIGPLMAIIRKGEEDPDYRSALLALSEMKYEGAFPYVIKIAKKEYPKNCGAINLLKEFGEPKCIPLLLEIKNTIKDGTPNARFYQSSIDDAIEEIKSSLNHQL